MLCSIHNHIDDYIRASENVSMATIYPVVWTACKKNDSY